MFRFFLSTVPALVFWGIFVIVVLTVPYPESLSQANVTQVIPFFASLYLALTRTFNIFFKNIFISRSISLGIILLLVLKALDSLNIITIIIVITAMGLLISYFRKTKKQGGFRRIRRIRGIRV